jgi:hypothetical protein
MFISVGVIPFGLFLFWRLFLLFSSSFFFWCFVLFWYFIPHGVVSRLLVAVSTHSLTTTTPQLATHTGTSQSMILPPVLRPSAPASSLLPPAFSMQTHTGTGYTSTPMLTSIYTMLYAILYAI